MESELDQTKAALDKAFKEIASLLSQLEDQKAKAGQEIDLLSQQFAQEKMDKTMALADLDAARNVKPDTSQLDALKAELDSANKARADQASRYASEIDELKSELEVSWKELESHKLSAEAAAKTAKADYSDMHDTMTQMLEEAQKSYEASEKRASQAEGRIKELEQRLSIAGDDVDAKKACDQRKIEELQAKFKIAEVRVRGDAFQ